MPRTPGMPVCGTTNGYRKGCRCEACKASATEAHRRYRAARAEAGDPVTYTRPTVSRLCEFCGETFDARWYPERAQFARWCSDVCCRLDLYGRTAGEGRPNRFRPSASLRRLVLERDAFVCWLCDEPIPVDAAPNTDLYGTLDHVLPRARGGADVDSNLRAAHMLCNARRGTALVEVSHG